MIDWKRLKIRLWRRLDLRRDQAGADEIDATIRAGVEFRGTNLWVLIFAIFVASIGLNVNSTAVIIGAMLISPLMGPIMALGYGAGINDSHLMRSALLNLGLAALISLITSTLYFAITPLSQAHSELLARTTPTIWDVLIALFGGLAGVIGVTRREKSNLVPGVAIATALMPPLCTAGYGLAVGNWVYFAGAAYLFAINAVFIAIATLMMVRVMKLPSINAPEKRTRIRQRNLIGLVIVMTVVPSLFLAVDLVRREVYTTAAEAFVQQQMMGRPSVAVISKEYDHRARLIRLGLAGERLAPEELAGLREKLPSFGLQDVKLEVVQSGQSLPDFGKVKRDLLSELTKSNRNEIEMRDQQISDLRSQLDRLQEKQRREVPLATLERELRAQWPDALKIQISEGLESRKAATPGEPLTNRRLLRISLTVDERTSTTELRRLHRQLRARAELGAGEALVLDFTRCQQRPRQKPACANPLIVDDSISTAS